MQSPTSKELYMNNGGNKLYIWKDGYSDVYHASAEEEAEWDKEIIATSLLQLEKERNAVTIKLSVNTLMFHQYGTIEGFLKSKLNDKDPVRKIAFANALWNVSRDKGSFSVLMEYLPEQGGKYIDEVFAALNDFKDCKEARDFLVHCITGANRLYKKKACTTIAMWAYGGMPALRDKNLLAALRSPDASVHQPAIEKLRKIFSSPNH
ncbi:hypothetical protein Q4E93_31605 [Flavitalea sp. BT771]|uniref:hypothetical protein n=1 Tax=Flavitalea sp. BT771 TaxID=3063329 RepID=UPI0026E2AC58|nr:hypothetical protein [Flavitalea sp. BT771]MDO6435205.1 hypothetical protein [Flavitalea sp. BT771]MDV6224090.1 hypothetical protein [Flavitalea sp. BT771]